jgi:hypothetical protein
MSFRSQTPAPRTFAQQFAQQVADRVHASNLDVVGELITLYQADGPVNPARLRILFKLLSYIEKADHAPAAAARPVPHPIVEAPVTLSAGPDDVTYH